ncbi:putative tetratricopeptide-like helical domain superfamily, DYW domain-containing protein [Dioscorea sansibarensis]
MAAVPQAPASNPWRPWFPSASLQKPLFFHPLCSLRPSPTSLSSSRSSKTIAKSFTSLAEKQTTDINAEIQRLCKTGDLKQAMDSISRMDCEFSNLEPETYCAVLELCADLGSLTDGRKVHSILSSSETEIDSVLSSKLAFMYLKCGDLREGRRFVEGLQSKDHPFLWNLLMYEYARNGDCEASVDLFERMWSVGIRPNSHTFSCILKCFANLKRVREGEKVHGFLLKLGFDAHNPVGNALVSCYSKCGSIESAVLMFDEMPDKDIISWNSIVNGCVLNGVAEMAVELFAKMWFTGIRMDLATLVSVLPALAEKGWLLPGTVVHGYSIKCGLGKEITLCNSLLNMYCKCGILESAERVFERMSEKSVVSWTSMISGYTRDGRFEEAIALFGQMEAEGTQPDLYAITTVLHACACHSAIEHGKSVHEYASRNGLESNLFVANALMDMYAKCGNMEDARSVFDRTINKDIVSWNTLIAGYSKSSFPDEALVLFGEMQCKMKPNCVTMACILPACGSISSLERGREIHGQILRSGSLLDGHVANALVDMYAKCGTLGLARRLFDRMVVKDLISWTVMIAGYGMHGCGKEAIAIFNEMKQEGIQPDEVSFIAILYACSHSGLIDEGWRFFNIMRHEYKIEPKLEHFACMVDLFSRAGQLTKAYKFIESMPIKPDATVWVALLCGCRIHRDVKLAERVAEHVFDLEPENTGYYILLANIYAEAEKWESVKKLRKRIAGHRLKKNPGCSWIEIKSRVQIFVSGDKSHPHSKKIELFLKQVQRRMKDEGHFPKKMYALMDADDSLKEEVLCGHSEKLAIAYGILNSSKGKPIRVTKNLRVCGDCHEVAKFISKITVREIILRDSNRFHHFKEGRCSCRGYW